MFQTIPYTITRTDEIEAPTVYLYGLSFCDHCAAGRRLLEELEIPFGVTYLDQLEPEIRRPVLRELREIYGKSVIYPVLEIGGEFTYGYNKAIWSDLLRSISQ